VRGRHNRTERVATLRFEGHLRGRRHAESDDLETLGGEAVTERPVEDVRRFTGVSADDDARDSVGAEHSRRGATETRREVGGEFTERDTTDSVGAELHRADPISAW